MKPKSGADTVDMHTAAGGSWSISRRLNRRLDRQLRPSSSKGQPAALRAPPARSAQAPGQAAAAGAAMPGAPAAPGSPAGEAPCALTLTASSRRCSQQAHLQLIHTCTEHDLLARHPH